MFQFSSYTYAFHKNVIRKAFNNVMDAGTSERAQGGGSAFAGDEHGPGSWSWRGVGADVWLRDELFNELAGTKKNPTDEAKVERSDYEREPAERKYGRIFEQFGQQRCGEVSSGSLVLLPPPSVAQAARATDSAGCAA